MATIYDENLTDFEVVIQSYPNKIEKNTELYDKIYDGISWVVFSGLDRDSRILSSLLNDSSIKLSFINVVELHLSQELLTNVKISKSHVIKKNDFTKPADTLILGFEIMIDADYIRNYKDIVNQQLVNSAINDLQDTKYTQSSGSDDGSVGPKSTFRGNFFGGLKAN